ncbi:MAG: SOS response-associated peptidase family protein [Candidatus Methylophosphatis roskildensis]
MCANYRPPNRESLNPFNRPVPNFAYGEAYPGSTAPILANIDRSEWVPACFGVVPHWAKDAKIARQTYNARSETVAEKPSYRGAWKNRQLCVIPAQAFFEPSYETGKPVRWRIERPDGKPFGIAGIFERHLKDDGLPRWSMSMLTLNATDHPLMRRFHKPDDEKRSVVILDGDEWDAWLDARTDLEVRSFFRPFEPELMTASAELRTPPKKSGSPQNSESE